ncbi:MAG: DUF5683 domain-containing protein [Gemmatimonadota bacterium]
MMSTPIRRRAAAFVFLFTCVAALPAGAQQAPQPIEPQPGAQDTARGISPGKAFMRSLLIPGWGQWSAGAKKRAGFFFALQTTSYYMLVKTLNKLDHAQDVEEERIQLVSDSLRAEMAEDSLLNEQLSDPLRFRAAVDSAETVIDIRNLVESREEQRQDWIAYTLFVTLASGVDAFVAAHLADFPATITTRPAPAGGMSVQVRVPVPLRP